MGIVVQAGSSVQLTIGQQWRMKFRVSGQADEWTSEVPVVTITLPDSSTVLPEVESYAWDVYSGIYEVFYIPLVAGRFTARATTAYGVVDLLAVVSAAATFPVRADLDAYLGGPGEHAWTDAELDQALAAETSAQMDVCAVPASFPAALREALLRRASRNLAMRRQLTAEPRGEGDVDLPAVLPSARDPEVRRLEGPYRKLPIG